MTLTRYVDQDAVTALDGSQYAEEDVTVEYPLGKSDAVWEAHERLRLGNHEAAGVWLLVAGGM
jgi:hypothetical protein